MKISIFGVAGAGMGVGSYMLTPSPFWATSICQDLPTVGTVIGVMEGAAA